MKRTVIILSLIFALAISLSVSIPTLAVSDTTTISGTLAPKIVVTAASDISSIALVAGATATGSSGTGGSVSCNKPWSITISDEKTSNDGYMTSATATKTALDSPFQIDVEGAGLVNAATGVTLSAQAKPGNSDISLAYSQPVSYSDDPAIDYTIDIIFNATID
jgi:hypothetical protein